MDTIRRFFADQAIGVGLEVVPGDLGRLSRLAREEGSARQPDQVAVSGLVLGEEDELVGRRSAAISRSGFGLARARERHDAADDRLDPRLETGLGELHGAEKIARIGRRHRRHAVPAAQRDEIGNQDRALGERKRRMDTKMEEIGVGHC